MKKIAVLGSTGSIGTQTLDVVRRLGGIQVEALAAASRIDLLEQQIEEFKPSVVCVFREEKALELKKRIRKEKPEILSGMDGLTACAALPQVDLVVAALVGMVGIQPAIAAVKSGKDIALANKETLVAAGHILMPLAREKGVRILPVDSEHSAIFQCLNGESAPVAKILLTASGGPFRGRSRRELESVTPEQALQHPNWAMGPKITIDSATMVNKGLEVMEAGWLFDVPVGQIQVVVQPQSIIHSMVEFADGCIMAQMGVPDMRNPIAYALYYPERRQVADQRLDLSAVGQIQLEAPDMDTFLGLKLAYQAGGEGGSMPTVYNAANEMAVSMFLRKEIRFLDIYDILQSAMADHKVIAAPTISEILEIEKETYDKIKRKKFG